jgi:hypothetical protein
MIKTSRRGFLLGAGSLLAAPAIVRAELLMPVRTVLRVPPVLLKKWQVPPGVHLVHSLSRHPLIDSKLEWKIEEIVACNETKKVQTVTVWRQPDGGLDVKFSGDMRGYIVGDVNFGRHPGRVHWTNF